MYLYKKKTKKTKNKKKTTKQKQKQKQTNNIYSRRMMFIFLTIMLKLTKSFHVLTIVIVLHRVFVWVSFDLRLLITHLVSTNFS